VEEGAAKPAKSLKRAKPARAWQAGPVQTVLNIIWLILAGFWLALGYVAAGIVCCLLIVTIPFGIASFRVAAYALWPFGKTVIDHGRSGVLTAIGNVIWFIVAGLWIAITHLFTGIVLCVTIIGIPLGIANFKMIPVSLFPLGKEIVDENDPRALARAH
jgi:uncharacterized membrane protein YccF (DUF307 family)